MDDFCAMETAHKVVPESWFFQMGLDRAICSGLPGIEETGYYVTSSWLVGSIWRWENWDPFNLMRARSQKINILYSVQEHEAEWTLQLVLDILSCLNKIIWKHVDVGVINVNSQEKFW